MTDLETFVSELERIYDVDLTDEEYAELEDKKLSSGVYVFRTLTSVQAYDILYTLESNKQLISKDSYMQYIRNGKFDTPEDVILNMEEIFGEEQKLYSVKRREEEYKNIIADSIHKCRRCNRPAVTTTKQTRSSDEGVTEFVTCSYCQITWKS